MTENGDAVRQFATELVEAAVNGRYDDVADAIDLLGRVGSTDLPAGVVGELVDRCAAEVRARHPADAGAVFTVVIEDDQAQQVEVDRLPPGPLAALRALLATLCRDEESRDIHIGLATRGRPEDVIGAMTHLLVWLVELSDPASATLPPLSCFAR
ncbi:hypothetical protein [Amycolatopsis sp. NPDC004378]